MKFFGGFTIGQYIPINSLIHSLDPRTKFLGLFILMGYILAFPSIYIYIILFFFLTCVQLFAQLKYRYIWKGIKPVIFLILFSAVFNLFFTPGEKYFWIITKEGVEMAILFSLRIYLLVFSSVLLTYTTSPIRLTDSIAYFMKPLRLFKVPVEDIALMLVIALRFIPTLVEEIERLIKAQMSRGVDFETGNIFVRLKKLAPIFIPLFVSCFKRADELAEAMESRCYRGGEYRTKREKLKYSANDYISFLVIFLLGVFLFYLRYEKIL